MRLANQSNRWRRPALALVTLIAALLPVAAVAQDGDTPESQLEEIESAIRDREAREKGLNNEVKDASGQVEKIRRELIDAAAVVQDQETQLGDTEREIADLELRYAERQAAFEKHRAELERTLAALALYARSPPQALIARPGEWADTVRGLKLLDNAIPALKESADAAAAEATALAALRDARSKRQVELADNTTALAETRADLRRLLERKSSLHATLVAERRRLGYEITALAADATDTRDLIDRLEMARVEASARQADEAAARAAQPADPTVSTGSLRADDLVVGAAPPPLEAPIEPTAANPVAVPSPNIAVPDPAAPAIEAEAAPRLTNTKPLSETPDETGGTAPAPPPTDLTVPELAAPEIDTKAAPRLANTTPLSETPDESGSTRSVAAPSTDLAAPELAVPEIGAEVAPRLADSTPLSETSTESGNTVSAAAPAAALTAPDLAAPEIEAAAASRLANTPPLSGTPAESGNTPSATAPPPADLAALETPTVAPDVDAPTRLAALPASPPRPPVKSSLPYPAHGDVIAQFGAGVDGGRKSLGASIRTRESAQVVAPRLGEVVFAGPFRGFGKLLILEHDGGYHSLLSGFSRIDAQVGQNVLAGEPVGVMGNVAESATILYIEIRQDRQPIDPIPWLLAGDRKVSG